jgi:AbrB family looped-hinge helix DNA binding protein
MSFSMITIRVGRRGQITIPRHIRRKMGVQEGDRIALVVEKDQVIMRPISQTLLDLRGSITVSAPQDFGAIRQQVIAERANKTGKNEP